MTPIVDRNGDLFGRINLVDAVCAAFVLGLIPVAYASLLLFRPAKPHITSVERAEVHAEERRIANGLHIQAKIKVRGDHFTPTLRAYIGTVPAIGFAFEDPRSADIIVGDAVPMGKHDLVLFDGAQEVARAPGIIEILPTPGAVMRVAGALIQLDEPTARRLHAGQRFEVNGHLAAEFLELGEIEPDRHRVQIGSGYVETPVAGSWRRAVLMSIHCEPDPDASRCRIGTTTLGDPSLSVLTVPGAPELLRVLVGEILPDAAPRAATARIRIAGAPEAAASIRAGDRDLRRATFDERTASVAEVQRDRSNGEYLVVLRLGVDRSGDGWRYKAQSLEPGSPFSLVTERYAVSGSVVSVVIDEP